MQDYRAIARKEGFYIITLVSREDLLSQGFTPKQVKSFTEEDMIRLAEKMANAYCENCFWTDLNIIAIDMLEDKK